MIKMKFSRDLKAKIRKRYFYKEESIILLQEVYQLSQTEIESLLFDKKSLRKHKFSPRLEKERKESENGKLHKKHKM